uniref:tRNA (guanine(10)-N(2))-dimethyltransferase n=1 Tax=Archaeoglobus fulgidus TaxID=2234 RepID=A0A7J2TGN4_ARCFL
MISFLLSGENTEIAVAEILSLANAFGKLKGYWIDERILTIDFEGEEFFQRLAFAHEAIELHGICKPGELEKLFSEIEISGSFCVRVSGVGFKTERDLERKLGAILWKKGAPVNLKNPDVVVRVYITKENCYVGFLKFKQEKKQFSQRRPDKRPFFMPVVVLPKLSRALVNLAAVKNGKILDPMCGTGSFLIEAALMGLEVYGMDYYRDIAKGCRENLAFMKLKGEILQGDVREMPFKDNSFDGIVTDYPYFRATRKVDRRDLYEKSLLEIRRVLKRGCRAVIVTNVEIRDFPMEVIYKLSQRVHGSLTRRIYVLRKS